MYLRKNITVLVFLFLKKLLKRFKNSKKLFHKIYDGDFYSCRVFYFYGSYVTLWRFKQFSQQDQNIRLDAIIKDSRFKTIRATGLLSFSASSIFQALKFILHLKIRTSTGIFWTILNEDNMYIWYIIQNSSFKGL